MKKVLIILALLITLSIPVSLLADDVSYAEYKGTIIGSNNGTAASNVVGALSLNATAWVTAGILNPDFDNLSIRDSSELPIPFMPGDNTTILFAGDFQATSNKMFTMYTGNVSGGDICYFPGSAGMSVNDTASMEWGANGQIILDDWFINTTAGADKNIIYHADTDNGGLSIIVDPTTDGTVTGRIITTANITPNALEAEGWPNPAPGGHYLLVDDAPGSPDGDSTYCYTGTDTTQYTDYYRLGTVTIAEGSQVISAKVFFNAKTDGASGGKIQPLLRLSGTNSLGTEVTITSAYANYSEVITKPGGGTWSQSDVDNLIVGAKGKGEGTHATRLTQEYVRLSIAYEVSLTGISTGKHDVTFTLSGGNLTLAIDGTSNTVAFGYAVPDSTSAWIMGESDTVKYVKGITLKVGGVTKGQWAYQNAAEFEDLSGNGNTGYPSFATTSSDPDVSFTLNDFSPISTATAEYNPDLDWPSMITATPTQPDTMYTENSTPGVFFAGLVHKFWPLSGVPESFFWYNFTFAIIIVASILSFRIHPSLLLKIIIGMAIMIFWALPGVNVYGMFVVIYKSLYCFGIMVLSKNYGW